MIKNSITWTRKSLHNIHNTTEWNRDQKVLKTKGTKETNLATQEVYLYLHGHGINESKQVDPGDNARKFEFLSSYCDLVVTVFSNIPKNTLSKKNIPKNTN